MRSIFPFFGFVQFAHVVSDFTGTLSVDRKLLPGIKERLNKISEIIEIHILTADTFCMAKEELRGVTCEIHILEGTKNDIQGERYVKKLGPTAVIFLGNGKKDRKMHKASRIDVSVLTEDVQSMLLRLQMSWFVQADDALDLLLNPKRMKAHCDFESVYCSSYGSLSILWYSNVAFRKSSRRTTSNIEDIVW